MNTNTDTQGAGHDFSPRGRKMLWGVPSQNLNIEPHNEPETTVAPRITPVNYILKPKSRGAQKWIKATGDYKPPHKRMSRQISCFVTLDQMGNKVSYYKYKPKPGHHRLPSYIRNEEIVSKTERVKRCTLHSYLQCEDNTFDKQNCIVCEFFRFKRED